jgi:hypothetical protein
VLNVSWQTVGIFLLPSSGVAPLLQKSDSSLKIFDGPNFKTQGISKSVKSQFFKACEAVVSFMGL